MSGFPEIKGLPFYFRHLRARVKKKIEIKPPLSTLFVYFNKMDWIYNFNLIIL